MNNWSEVFTGEWKGPVEPPTLSFYQASVSDIVLTFRYVDGVLCAEYDPARLDDAARTLIDHATRILTGADGSEA